MDKRTTRRTANTRTANTRTAGDQEMDKRTTRRTANTRTANTRTSTRRTTGDQEMGKRRTANTSRTRKPVETALDRALATLTDCIESDLKIPWKAILIDFISENEGLTTGEITEYLHLHEFSTELGKDLTAPMRGSIYNLSTDRYGTDFEKRGTPSRWYIATDDDLDEMPKPRQAKAKAAKKAKPAKRRSVTYGTIFEGMTKEEIMTEYSVGELMAELGTNNIAEILAFLDQV